MTLVIESKLKNLLTHWAPGTIYLSSHLKKKGIGYDLQRLYRESGWTVSLGQGAVAKAGDQVTWLGGLHALQTQGKAKLHVSGKTALALSGLAHFVPLAKEQIHISGPPKSKLPTWFRDHKWDVQIHLHQSTLFPVDFQTGLQSLNQKSFSVRASSPERAFFELLDLVPQEQTFEEARLISESLTTLRPKIIQELLENCSSIKVKRLFLFFAELQNHAWLTKLDLKKIDLGTGDRQVVKGGVIDSKYRITVPEHLK